MQNQNIEAEVLVASKPVAEYRHDTGRFFVEGKEGSEYALRIRNNNDHRVMVVVGVDGINVVDSKPIGTKKDEAGYVIDANGSLTIKGYRIDNDNVAAFKFTAADQAYASKDKKLNGTTGVISVRAYREKEKPLPPAPTVIKEDHHHYHKNWGPWIRPYRKWWNDGDLWFESPQYTYTHGGAIAYGTTDNTLRGMSSHTTSSKSLVRSASVTQSAEQAMSFSACAVAPVADVAQQSLDSNPFALGSSWGAKAESKVREVEFKVGVFLAELTLYYTTREGLKTLGIDLTRAAQVVFPDHAPGKYCTPPSGWKAQDVHSGFWMQPRPE